MCSFTCYFDIPGKTKYEADPWLPLMTGCIEGRSLGAALGGDLAAADAFEYTLQETGVSNTRPTLNSGGGAA
ncbi:MAG: hypothetical protein ABS35_01960 [Kaistia sp. SCN 65-12]|nr:MAG: hypothetical protein ABS35_01960 [Kaistia sp. SCN 65-12]